MNETILIPSSPTTMTTPTSSTITAIEIIKEAINNHLSITTPPPSPQPTMPLPTFPLTIATSANPGGSTRLYSSTHRWYSDP